jgi:hypothetical protein
VFNNTKCISVIHVYHSSQFYCWRNPEYPEKTTNLPQVTGNTLSPKVVSSTPRHEQDWNPQRRWWYALIAQIVINLTTIQPPPPPPIYLLCLTHMFYIWKSFFFFSSSDMRSGVGDDSKTWPVFPWIWYYTLCYMYRYTQIHSVYLFMYEKSIMNNLNIFNIKEEIWSIEHVFSPVEKKINFLMPIHTNSY